MNELTVHLLLQVCVHVCMSCVLNSSFTAFFNGEIPLFTVENSPQRMITPSQHRVQVTAEGVLADLLASEGGEAGGEAAGDEQKIGDDGGDDGHVDITIDRRGGVQALIDAAREKLKWPGVVVCWSALYWMTFRWI